MDAGHIGASPKLADDIPRYVPCPRKLQRRRMDYDLEREKLTHLFRISDRGSPLASVGHEVTVSRIADAGRMAQ
jgi:hypothetical protein